MERYALEGRAYTATGTDGQTITKTITTPVEYKFADPRSNARSPFGMRSSNNSFSNVTVRDRLDICTHGNEQFVGWLTPEELARELFSLGLREVGVLRILSCHTGSGDYLERLRESLDAQGISVGYLSGYRGFFMENEVYTLPYNSDGSDSAQVNFGPIDQLLHPTANAIVGLGPFNTSLTSVAPRLAQKTIKGNADVVFKVSQYDLPGDFRSD